MFLGVGILSVGLRRARKAILKPAYARTHLLNGEAAVIRMWSNHHWDYAAAAREQQPVARCSRCVCVCALYFLHSPPFFVFSCRNTNPISQFGCHRTNYTVSPCPCVCKLQLPTETLRIVAYSPRDSTSYSMLLPTEGGGAYSCGAFSQSMLLSCFCEQSLLVAPVLAPSLPCQKSDAACSTWMRSRCPRIMRPTPNKCLALWRLCLPCFVTGVSQAKGGRLLLMTRPSLALGHHPVSALRRIRTHHPT